MTFGKIQIAAVAALVLVLGLGVWWMFRGGPSRSGSADASNTELVALGQQVYGKQCASCHGANLEGEKDWRTRKPDGGLRAPPHDASGHTWHHPDGQLFQITKLGGAAMAGPGFKSNMPAFKGTLTDRQIWAVLSYIKSRWPQHIRERHAQMMKRVRSGR